MNSIVKITAFLCVIFLVGTLLFAACNPTDAPNTTDETTLLEGTSPDITTPEVTTPEVTTPEVTTPEVTTPEVTTPEVTTPEVTTPEVTTPEVTTPEVTTPETTTPEVTTPETHVHTEEPIAAVVPTCTKTGLSEGKKCAECGEILVAQKVLSELEHSFGEWAIVQDPTPDEDGYKERRCTLCGEKNSLTILYSDYIQPLIASLVSYQSSYASFKPVNQSPAGVSFDFGYHYVKQPGQTIDKSALVWNMNYNYGYVSFELYVHSVKDKNGAPQTQIEFQLYNGAKFVSVVDSNGNSVAIVNKNEKPNVVLTKGKSYRIVLDMTEASRPEFYVGWSGKVAELYFYNFNFNKPTYTYVVDDAQKSIVCYKNGEEYGYFAWPTVTKLDGTRLMAVASGMRNAHIDIEGKLVCWFSEDEGKTWSEPQLLVDTVLDDRDSGVVYWNGKIIVSWFCASKEYFVRSNPGQYTNWANGISDELDTKLMGGNYIISEDGGKTWSDIYGMPEGMFTPHGLILNPNGGLTSVGYLKYDKVNKRWGSGIAVRTTTGEMDENGFIWSDPIIIADTETQYSWDFQEPYGIYNDDGVLIVVMRSDRGLFQCELQPGESKFSNWHIVAHVQETPAHLFRHSSGVLVMTYGYRGIYVDPVTGKTVSYTERRKDTTLGIRARLSYDGGLTWTHEVILTTNVKVTDDKLSDWGYTSTVELSDGKLLTLYYQRTAGEKMASIYQIVWELPAPPKGMITLNFVGGKLLKGTSDIGDGLLITTRTGKRGEAIVLPPNPTKIGYTFEGWYLDYACTLPFTATTYSKNLTLYAKWS